MGAILRASEGAQSGAGVALGPTAVQDLKHHGLFISPDKRSSVSPPKRPPNSKGGIITHPSTYTPLPPSERASALVLGPHMGAQEV